MAKDPAFLFYSSDFLTGVAFMTNEEVGTYIKLLCLQHQHGGIIPKESFNAIALQMNVRNKFIEDDEGFFNERLMKEMSLRAVKSSNLSKNAQIRWSKYKQDKCKCNAIALDLHMPIEDEDVNINSISIKKRKESMREKENKGFFIDNQLIEYSFWGMVVKFFNGDKYQAQLVFYRAHAAEAESITGWITKGLNKDKEGKQYALCCCADEYDNKPDVKEWVDNMFNEIPSL